MASTKDFFNSRKRCVFLVEVNPFSDAQGVPDGKPAEYVRIPNLGHVLPEGLVGNILDKGVTVGNGAAVISLSGPLRQKLGYVDFVSPDDRRTLF